jgi:hypothetical protein
MWKAQGTRSSYFRNKMCRHHLGRKGMEVRNFRYYCFVSFLGHGLLIHEVSRSQTTTHHSLVGLLWTIDQFVAETSILTTRNTQNRQISIPPGGIRTHSLSRLAAAFLHLIPRDHWEQLTYYTAICFLNRVTLHTTASVV